MIEVLRGERGQTVVRRDGRLLASRFDPVGEAEAWVARNSEFLNDVKAVFVLGLGAGYHVLHLAEKTKADLIVIEPDQDLVRAVDAIHSFSGGDGGPRGKIRIISPHSLHDLRSSREIREAVKTSFALLAHQPSVATGDKLLKEAASLLRGRDWGALQWQWKIKTNLSFDSVPRIESGSEPLTIYDLEQTELVQDSSERERLLFKALRELVK